MGLNAGQMRREIVLQTATPSTDATGQEILTWDTGETLWARWLPAGTRETWHARQVNSDIDGMYEIYFRAEPKPDVNRIRGHDGRTYDVKPCIVIGDDEGWAVPVVAKGEV